jgi:hypothetical protein
LALAARLFSRTGVAKSWRGVLEAWRSHAPQGEPDSIRRSSRVRALDLLERDGRYGGANNWIVREAARRRACKKAVKELAGSCNATPGSR